MKKLALLAAAMLLTGSLVGLGIGTASATDDGNLPVLTIRDDGEIRIADGIVKAVDPMSGILVVKAEGQKFHVKTSAATDIRVDDTTSLDGLMKGDKVDVRGMADTADAHLILADRVELKN